MILSTSSSTAKIDRYCDSTLGISVRLLMERAGTAVANVVRDRVLTGSSVVIFAGKGNNGGDGYAAAVSLYKEYDVTVFDIFSAGQRTEEGKYFMNLFESLGGRIIPFSMDDENIEIIKNARCVIDAIFGTGFRGEIPVEISKLSRLVSELVGTEKLAIDVPIGVNADDGSVDMASACAMTATIALGFVKPGLVSYPAKAYIGKLIYDNLSLPKDDIMARFDFSYYYIDDMIALSGLPPRPENSNKGSFGKLLSVVGSDRYQGAAFLSVEASLRGGAGLVSYLGERHLSDSLCHRFPEVVYKHIPPVDRLGEGEIELAVKMSLSHSATLIGSGSGHTDGLHRLVRALLATEGTPLILDADAVNVLSDDPVEGRELIRNSRRKIILTPHPLEFSRLSGIPVSTVQLNRISVSQQFALDYGCILILKGAATIVTDGVSTYINSSGSSALAKAGSGDVLAGFLASLVASGADPLLGSASAVYFHGRAADTLAREYSTLGVTPSDLPREIVKSIASMTSM